MIAIEKVVHYSQFPKGRDMPCQAGPQGAAPGPVRRQREGRNWQEPLLWFPWEGTGRQDGQA